MPSNTLDSFLNDFEEKAKREQDEKNKQLKELQEKRDHFVAKYTTSESKVIKPMMENVKSKLKNHGFETRFWEGRDMQISDLPQVSYLITHKEKNCYIRISFYANVSNEKLHVRYVFPVSGKSQKDDNTFDIDEITEEFVEDSIAIGLKKVL